MTAVATVEEFSPDLMEKVLVKGDLKDLSPADRLSYYQAVCKSLNLNPLTQPFQYITLSGRLTLYATRTATDQIRTLHGVSIVEMRAELSGDVYIVTVRARDKHGREEMSTGAVPIKGLSGEALANAYMKCETKAKRRVTLSLCGLGWLDESEVDSIPQHAARYVQVDTNTGEIVADVSSATISEEGVKALEAYAKSMDMSAADLMTVSDELHGNKDYRTLTTNQGRQLYRKLEAMTRGTNQATLAD